MATLAFHFIVEQTIMNWRDLQGATKVLTIPKPSLLGYSLRMEWKFYYFELAFCLCMVFVAANLGRSKIGRALCAIRDGIWLAEAIGISLTKYKLLSFFISSVYAGIAGALMAGCLAGLRLMISHFFCRYPIVSMVIVGGLGSVVGSILGSIAINCFLSLECSDGHVEALLSPHFDAIPVT